MEWSEYDVILLPSAARVQHCREQEADGRAGGVFSQTVTTFDAWIADLWELHGDGRALVGAALRNVALHEAFRRIEETMGLKDPFALGVVPLAATCARLACGTAQFERALEEVRETGRVVGLSEPEARFMSAIALYEDDLLRLGVVEPGVAAMELAERHEEVFPFALRVLVAGQEPLGWVVEQFLARCPNLEVTHEREGEVLPVGKAPARLDVRFAFPSGKSAQSGLVGDILLGREGSQAVVACADPFALFADLVERLVVAGRTVCVEASRPFARSDFGRAFLALYHYMNDDAHDGALLTDALLSPFSGFSRTMAFEIDRSVRADRLVRYEDVLQQLRVLSERFSQLEELASDPQADVLCGVFEQLAQSLPGKDVAWRSEQLAALGALRDIAAAARRVGAGMGVCVSVLERTSLKISSRTAPPRGESAQPSGTVTIAGMRQAAALAQESCDILVVADLTSQDCPVADKEDAGATLLDKLGLHAPDSALARARREFGALLELPRNELVIVRSLADENAEEAYPAIVLEEFVDAYRADPSATDDIDNPFRLPEPFVAGVEERGEELLYQNAVAGPASARQDAAARVGWPHVDAIEERQRPLVAPRRRDSAGQDLGRPCPSPSQIETYLECPFRWFVQRRMKLDALDEGFGPLERGSFAHAVFEDFYGRFQEAGFTKVNAENLEQARALMRSVVAEVVVQQEEAEPGSGRLVAATELERRELAAFTEQLVSYLDTEARLLPTFKPTYFEYEIDADHALEYAGGLLVGKVDRIDVDDAGRAVILDYKGSVGADYEIAGKTAAAPGKVQTRIYAQAVKRALGLDVVAALYVSYGRRPKVAGAFDPRVVEAAHLPGVRADKCACGLAEEVPESLGDDFAFAELTFPRMLDATEELARGVLARMQAGDITPKPVTPGACTYCPAIACPKRGA